MPAWCRPSQVQLVFAATADLEVAFENRLGMRFVLIPPGTFTMGSPVGEKGRLPDEAQHEVTLTKPY